MMTGTAKPAAQRGSIYIITLFTVAAIVSMVLIGVSLRQVGNNETAIVELMSENNTGSLDATELALAKILSDPQWDVNAAKGAVFSDTSLGGRTYSSTVIDADTLGTPDADTSVYRVGISSDHAGARSMARFDLRHERFDYLGMLNKYDVQHYWPLNETNNPGQARDHKANNHGFYRDPSIAGEETNDEGGWVPVFQDNADYVEIPWGSNFQQSRASMTMWVKWTGDDPFQFYGILGMLRSSSSNDSPTLSVGIYYNRLIAYVTDDDDFESDKMVWSSAAVPQDEWFHLAVSWGHLGLRIYINGAQSGHNEDNEDGTKSYIVFPWLTREPMLIGAGYEIASSSYTRRGFEGSIAHVTMLNEQLIPEQAAELASQMPDEFETEIIEDSWVRVFE
ncbi:MAG: LamG-like jellyroll fold domain-containing protein [Phycisphaerales bacterium]